ncbi:MAG: TolC family protein [Cryomorphaceae bacterium]|jgi:outer membrane protein TolC|nr:TolC family protein [Cryomorphaceae bacterium]
MKRLIAGFILISALPVHAQQLDLETCLRMADTANLTLRNARLDIAITDKNRDAYLSARLPQISFTGDYKYNAIIPGQVVPAAFFGGPPGTFSTVQFGVPFVLSNNVQLTQILFNTQLNYGLAALRVNNQIVDIQMRMTEQEVRHQIASTYFNLQAVNRQLTFVRGNLANMEKLIRNMEAMVAQQIMLQTDVDKLTINQLSLQNTDQTLRATKFQLEGLLRILIGMNADAPLSLAPDAMVEKSILVELGETSYPELELIKTQMMMNKEERKGNNMAYLPNLSFYGTYNYSVNMKPEDSYRVGIEGAFLGLRLDWTLFDGLEKVHKQAANKFNAEKLNNQLEQTQQQLDLRRSNALNQIGIQTTSLKIAQEQLKLADNIYNQTATKFEQGVASSNDLIMADNALQQAQTTVVASYIQLRQAELDYLKSIGSIK